MDNRPIGIFDSGVGGLTVAKEIYRALPQESTVYVGDTARIPYGTRSRETIIRFSHELTRFLIGENVKMIVVACATASSQAIDSLQDTFRIPILGVIEPAAQMAVKATKTGEIGVIGTKSSISSGAFNRSVGALDSQTRVMSQACPLLVPFIEEGITTGPLLTEVLHYYLDAWVTPQMDTLILGCTHYPLITNAISHSVSQPLHLVNPGIGVAHFLKATLAELNLEAKPGQRVTHRYFTTDNPQGFLNIAQLFLGQAIHNHTEQVSLE